MGVNPMLLPRRSVRPDPSNRASRSRDVSAGTSTKGTTHRYGMVRNGTQAWNTVVDVAAQPKETIVDRFAYALAYRGITPAQLALRAGDSGRTTVLRYVRGQVCVYRQDIVARYAKAFGCDPVWLMLGPTSAAPNWDPDWK